MQRFHVDGRCRLRPGRGPEHPGSPVKKLGLPGRDLVGMDIELLGQLGQGLLASQGSQSHLRLEGRKVVPALSLAHHRS